MSWSVHVAEAPAKSALAELKKAFAAANPTPSPEVVEQFKAALSGLEGSLKAISPAGGNILVAISANGHANPGHKKPTDWPGIPWPCQSATPVRPQQQRSRQRPPRKNFPLRSSRLWPRNNS